MRTYIFEYQFCAIGRRFLFLTSVGSGDILYMMRGCWWGYGPWRRRDNSLLTPFSHGLGGEPNLPLVQKRV